MQLFKSFEKLEIRPNYDVECGVSPDLLKLARVMATDLIQQNLVNGEPARIGLVFLDKRFLALQYVPGCPVQRLIFTSTVDLVIEVSPEDVEKIKQGGKGP